MVYICEEFEHLQQVFTGTERLYSYCGEEQQQLSFTGLFEDIFTSVKSWNIEGDAFTVGCK